MRYQIKAGWEGIKQILTRNFADQRDETCLSCSSPNESKSKFKALDISR